jgi:L-threonylcarbamoyladenylate synthase
MPNRIEYPKTTINSAIAQCAEILNGGGVICVPTDTVYGLICRWDNPNAIERMYSIKVRDIGKPFAVFTDSWNRIEPYLSKPSPMAEKLTHTYWPGALTVLVPVAKECPCSLDGKLGVRSPNYPLITQLVSETRLLIANTSFNLSQEPPLSVLPKEHELYDQVDLVIDAGDLGEPVPSTVCDCTGENPVVLRVGKISQQEILSSWQSS